MHSIITNNCQSDRKKLLCVLSDMIKEEKVCFIIITAFEDIAKELPKVYMKASSVLTVNEKTIFSRRCLTYVRYSQIHIMSGKYR